MKETTPIFCRQRRRCWRRCVKRKAAILINLNKPLNKTFDYSAQSRLVNIITGVSPIFCWQEASTTVCEAQSAGGCDAHRRQMMWRAALRQLDHTPRQAQAASNPSSWAISQTETLTENLQLFLCKTWFQENCSPACVGSCGWGGKFLGWISGEWKKCWCLGEKSICGAAEGSVCEPLPPQETEERVLNELTFAF